MLQSLFRIVIGNLVVFAPVQVVSLLQISKL